jgi:predicted phage tail protein
MFDVYIQSQADAWQVIKDIAAGFNGMTFWGNNMFNVVSDMPADTRSCRSSPAHQWWESRCTRAAVKKPLLQRAD